METSIVGTVVDFGFLLFSLWAFFALTALGVLLIWLSWRWIFVAYVLIIIVALIRFFRMPRETDDEINTHLQNKDKVVAMLRWPFRVFISLIMLYLSWSLYLALHLDVSKIIGFSKGDSSKTPPMQVNGSAGELQATTSSVPTGVAQVTNSNPISPNEAGSKEPKREVTKKDASRPQRQDLLYVNTQLLNVRSGPGIDYKKVGRLSYGEKVIVNAVSENSRDGNWVKGVSGDTRGWINKKYLAASIPTGVAQASAKNKGRDDTAHLNTSSGDRRSLARGTLNIEELLANEKRAGSARVEKIPGGRFLVGTSLQTAFDEKSAQIKPALHSALDKIATIASAYDTVQLEITGHTDALELMGNIARHQYLSELRADAVFSYLLRRRVPRARMKRRGYGQNEPIASNKTAQGRSYNRRVDILITVAPY
ncbi:OmpA family protein [Thioflavicoccus mobilis]|nr:OmpA family protein [Thioflavicoccus mobilis]